jgi:hypothetical protein
VCVCEVAAHAFRLGMTLLRSFNTLGVGRAVLRSNSITLLAVVEMLTPFGWAVECYLEPCHAGFYLVVLLDCLLCNWLFGRACRSGQVKN